MKNAFMEKFKPAKDIKEIKTLVMKVAWGMRKYTAQKLGVKVSAISMSECLKMAWEDIKTKECMVEGLTVVEAFQNFIDKAGYVIKKIWNDGYSTKFRVDVIKKSVKYYDYKNDKQYCGFDTINGTYDSKTKTIDLIAKNVIINIDDKKNVVVNKIEDIEHNFFMLSEDEIKFFGNFDWESEEALEMFK